MTEATTTADPAKVKSDDFDASRIMVRNGAFPPAVTPGSPLFTRETWTLLLSPDTIGQTAGVPKSLIRRLVLKELADNSADASGACRVFGLSDGGYCVGDEGPGLPANSPEEVARLFSMSRPLTSSKQRRLPTRGALGNGLRVVVGAVACSNGRLQVTTRGVTYTLTPRHDGSTDVVASPCTEGSVGTWVSVWLGEAIPADPNALSWAKDVERLATGGDWYDGRPSPTWYSSDAFFALCQAAGQMSARDVVQDMAGCTASAVAGSVASPFKGRLARSLTRAECDDLLAAARSRGKPIKPHRLGGLGPTHLAMTGQYAVKRGELSVPKTHNRHGASIPYVVEAWVRPSDRDQLRVYVNRSPVATSEFHAGRESGHLAEVAMHGCGLHHFARVGKRPASISVHIVSPYVVTSTTGKTPDLESLVNPIVEAVELAGRRAARVRRDAAAGQQRVTLKSIVTEHMAAIIEEAGGGGGLRFSQRQMFYAARPYFLRELGREPKQGSFNRVLTEIESARGSDIPGLYRDERGVMIHPHTGDVVPLGTLSVDSYTRPKWNFCRAIYIEKRGFFEGLRAAKWPERNDCALLSSQGYATRAVRDMLDMLGDGDEPIEVFAVHDADGFGTSIFEALSEATLARGKRKVKIINLGLDPWEAMAMGLQVETFPAKKSRITTATYVREHEPDDQLSFPPESPIQADGDGDFWEEWLQRNRIELNAMSTAAFIEWLDRKMALHSSGKLIPPVPVMIERLDDKLKSGLRDRIVEQVLAAAGIDQRVEQVLAVVNAGEAVKARQQLEDRVEQVLEELPEDSWSDSVDFIAKELVDAAIIGEAA